MAYKLISGIVPQLRKRAGGASASGYYLKAYEAGTTTNLSMGIDQVPSATLAKCKLNTLGEPISNDSDETSVFIPAFNAVYKLALYRNSTDADNNTTANALWVVDDIDIGADITALDIPLTINGIDINVSEYLNSATVDTLDELRNNLSSSTSPYGIGANIYVRSTGGPLFTVEDIGSNVDDDGIIITGGSFAAVRSVDSTVHLKWFEPEIDGTTDLTAKVNKALSRGYGIVDGDGIECFIDGIVYVQSDTVFRNCTLSYNNSSGNSFRCDGTQNIVIENITFIGKAAGLINLRNGANNVTVQNCLFDSYEGATGILSQLLWLFDCSNVKFLNNTLRGCGYGVITQIHYASDDVLVSFNHISDAYNDFVEANGATVKSENWTVTNNIYLGSNGWPDIRTERRFVGFTEVEHVIVSNNIVINVSGDSAVHLEDLYGETIVSNNIFKNWLGTACVYNLNSDEDCIITGNIFRRTNSSEFFPPAISTSSNSYDHTVTISGNRFEDFVDDANRFLAISAKASGKFLIEGNQVRNCSALVSTAGTDGTLISGNKVVNCTAGIIANITPEGAAETTSAGNNISVVSNHIDVTDSSMGIVASTNTSGTSGANQWFISGNNTNGDIRILNSSGVSSNGLNNAVSGNYLRDSATVTVQGGAASRLSADADGNFSEV